MAKTKITETEISKPASKPTQDWGKLYDDMEDYIILHQKSLALYGGIFLGFVALILAYIFLYLGPRQVTAKNQIFKAQEYFAADSLDKALKGDGNNPGFESIASEYSQTESANLAHYYLGSIYLRKGQFQKAIDALKDYSAKDKITSCLALGMTGDAYAELNNYDQALSYYRKAETANTNNFTTPMYLFKEGLILEHQKQYAAALSIYQKIKKEFSETSVAKDIDKYIARVNQEN